MTDQGWEQGVNNQLSEHKQLIDDLTRRVTTLENKPGPDPDPHHDPHHDHDRGE